MDLTYNGNTPQTILFNNNNVAKVTYNGVDVWYQKISYEVTSIQFPVTLTKTLPLAMTDYKIYGVTHRDGTPNMENPKELKSVGDLVTDTQDAHYGEYKIPVLATNENNQTITTNIYLSEPLRRFK